MTLPPGARVFVATEPVDGRKGIDGLSVLVRSRFAEDPLSGRMFVFFSRRADRVRVLHWDRDGYVLIMKRLEKGRYKLPWRTEQGRVVIEAAELLLVLEGIELKGARRRSRWSPPSQVSAPHTLCDQSSSARQKALSIRKRVRQKGVQRVSAE